jgi:hypothetical protein
LTSPAEETEAPAPASESAVISLLIAKPPVPDSMVDNDGSGISVSSAGDVNGDGSDDLIIGAYGANGFAGKSFVVFGKNDTKSCQIPHKFYLLHRYYYGHLCHKERE